MDGFGGTPRVIGRTVWITQGRPQPFEIVGVMPPQFDFPQGNGVWVPLGPSPRHVEALVALLREGTTHAEVRAQLHALSARLAAAYTPRERAEGKPGVTAGTLKQAIPWSTRGPLWILLGAVGFVLLEACVNLSALLLARGWTRRHEIATRRALGASRLRIMRQLFAESSLLAAAGGGLGLLFAVWGIRALRAIAPPGTPRVHYVVLDAWVLGFALGATVLAALLFGLAPAWQAASRRNGESLSDGLSRAPADGPGGRHVLRTALILAEVALSVLLVTGGALMGRSLYKLVHSGTGTRPGHVVTMSVQLGPAACRRNTGTRCALVAAKILRRARALPGVQTVALLGTPDPFRGGSEVGGFRYPGMPLGLGLYVQGSAKNQLALKGGGTSESWISPGFFAAMGIGLRKGRDFTASDLAANRARLASLRAPAARQAARRAGGPGACTFGDGTVAIVSESFARRYIPGDPIGKYFYTCRTEPAAYWTKIVGVVNDIRDHALRRFAPAATFYEPIQGGDWTLVARTSTDPRAGIPAMRRVVSSADRDAMVTRVETVNAILAASSAKPRFDTLLLGSFGAIGLALALIGLYGLLAYSVTQRTHEIGVRMALGAPRGHVLRLALQEGAAVALGGIALGMAGAFALTHVLRSLLYGITPTDPGTFAGTALLMLGTALAACYLPARRALGVDPLAALRGERSANTRR